MKIKLDDNFFQQLLLQADESPRKRSHYNLHTDLAEPVQRLCIGLKKGSYVRPHHHPQNNKWELMLALRGSVVLIIFDAQGMVLEKTVITPGNALSGIEMKPGTYHTIATLSDEAVILEVKEGPFIPTAESDFASWAPAEGEAAVAEFQDWLDKANPGELYPS